MRAPTHRGEITADTYAEATHNVCYRSRDPFKVIVERAGIPESVARDIADPARSREARPGEMVRLTLASGSWELLDLVERNAGRVAWCLPDVSSTSAIPSLTAESAKEFGEWMLAAAAAINKGTTFTEAAALEREAHELIAKVLATVDVAKREATPAARTHLRSA